MRRAHVLAVFFLLPLFGGCQLWQGSKASGDSQAGQTRLQGVLANNDGQWVFQPCNEQRRFAVSAAASGDLAQQVNELVEPGKPVFADLRGHFVTSPTGELGTATVQRVYRLETSTAACADKEFQRMTLAANGHTPEWSVRVGERGLVLDRAGQAPLALPYLEEQSGDGRFNLSSEANGLRVQLWVAPQSCIDPASGNLRSLSAQLRVNDDVQQGCAWFGGARND